MVGPAVAIWMLTADPVSELTEFWLPAKVTSEFAADIAQETTADNLSMGLDRLT